MSLKICRKNNWQEIIVIKEGRIQTLFREALLKKDDSPENTLEITIDKKVKQKLSWVHYLKYGDTYVHVIICEEQKTEKAGTTTKTWVWISSFIPDKHNIRTLVNKGGRQRWKIENQGFKEQKREDYRLEHLYCENPNAWKY